MAANKIDARQSKLTSAQAMLGSAANDTLDTIFPKINDEIAKLFEDRNVQLTDGGLVTYVGTSVQFTQSLKLHINSKVAGGAPVIIDLGSTTRTISADGKMIYAIIDRVAGTAAVTDDSSTLPAVTSTNQEVFLIAKRSDSPDGIKRLYFRNGSAFNEGQTARLGSAGSGNGTGGAGDDINDLTFKASFTESFDDIPSSSLSSVNSSAGKTDATLYSAVNSYFRLAYDGTKTITGTGTAMTLSSAATFIVKAGDVITVGSSLETRIITNVASQTSFTINAAFSTNPSAAACVVSQAVHTKDLNGTAFDGNAISSAFTTSISQVMVDYEDTVTAGDSIFDLNTVPSVYYIASSDNTNWTTRQGRSQYATDTQGIVNLPTTSTGMYLVFFASAASTGTSGSANILRYKAYFHRDLSYLDGSILNQASGFTNGSTGNNVTSIGLVSGKTRIKLSWSFPVDANTTTPNGALKVYINGQKIPRYIDATKTPYASYKEIDANTLELDSDYSASDTFFEVVQDVAVIDSSDTNVTAIAQAQESVSEAFQGFVKTSTKISATNSVGAPAAGTFYSSIVNRAAISDLTQDLKPRMGIERIMAQQIFLLQNEFGPNGEIVSSLGDYFDQVRLVGNWTLTNVGNWAVNNAGYLNDYIEVTFFGTGLNLVHQPSTYGTALDLRVSTDGGSEGSALFTFNHSTILASRNYNANLITNLVSGLTQGVHTVKIRIAAAPYNFSLFGFEILNETTSIKVQPGSAYLSGKKLVTSAQSTLAYNSTFESGTLGTKGGRVLVYQKADGTIAKAVQPVDTTQLTLSSTNHSNEEAVRTYTPREFGAGRADDFSTLTTTSSNRAFTLDDNTATLVGVSAAIALSSPASTEVLYNSTVGSITYRFTFIGTGLDVVLASTSAAAQNFTSIQIDGNASIGSITQSGSFNKYTQKIVSGLPYGTHTVLFTCAAPSPGIASFIVYQPKKPTLPAGAIELADYNILANYSANATAGSDTVSSGVIRKMNTREFIHFGTFTAAINTADSSGWNIYTSTAGDFVEYSFFGTGFDYRFTNNASATVYTMTVDGSTNLSSYTTSSYGAGVSSFVPSTGVINGSATATNNNGVQVSGLTLGWHKVRVTRTSGTGNMFPQSFDIITPIHSHKSNLIYDLQNTLVLGNTSISDNRNISAIKDNSAKVKNISQAFGVQASPSTTSTSPIPMPDMSLTHYNRTGRVKISYTAVTYNSTTAANVTQVYVGGIAVGTIKNPFVTLASREVINTDSFFLNVTPGFLKLDVFWYTSGGTMYCNATNRNFTVEEA